MTYELAPERVVDKIKSRITVLPSGCWAWEGSKSLGYGRICWKATDGKVWRGTHRVMYEALVGRIPEGMDLDHLCHDPADCAPDRAMACPHRACCNPDHLHPATRRENLLRGGTVSAARRAVERCPKGHAYDDENTLTSKGGQRQCKACTYERNRAYYWKNVSRRAAYNRAWREKRKGA